MSGARLVPSTFRFPTRPTEEADSSSTLARRRTSSSTTLYVEQTGGRKWGLGNLLVSLSDATRAPIARLKESHGSLFADEDVNREAQARARAAGVRPDYKLTFWGCMVAGAVSRRWES